MAAFKSIRPLPEVRLRSWPAGRVSVLKLAVQKLQEEVNQSLADGSQQTERRRISDQIPFILDLSVAPGFRQVQATWSRPPGLGGHPERQLLFYEVQHDASPAFPTPITITTPQRSLEISGLGLGETRSFRARTVSTFGKASVWSSVVTVKVAQSQIQTTPLTDASIRLEKPVGVWQTISDTIYTPVDADAAINASIGVMASHFDTDRKDPDNVTRKTLYGGPAHVQLRWMVGSLNSFTERFELVERGQRAVLSARPGFADTSGDKSAVRGPYSFGSFTSPFIRLTPGTQAKVRLEAALTPGSEWKGSELERDFQTSSPVMFLRNGQVIEVLRGV